ncbi:CARDB domain-containing protein [Natrinema salinisoli]|uniref:CARDB domain-containing protein n=1 Tax=Natrinema salinisoli TaxID=2878535 RepID=UPI001CF019DC|nr:CARDB domain-containing protein [Natrinema salinisoli]
MTRRNSTTNTVTYSILATIAVVVALAVSATAVAGATTAPPDPDEYAVAQGDDCVTVEPIGDGARTIEEFYDYRTPNTTPSSYSYSSHGTTHLQEDDTSSVFLYEGSDGLSLVLLHDRYDGDSPGGAATMTFSGLPEDGEWVVEDDGYDGADDEFDHSGDSSRITWVWSENRSDGAAFNGGLDDEFSITIEPRFNDDAAKQLYDGRVRDWEVISGTDTGRERTSLDMNEPVVITSGECTSHSVTDLNVTESVRPGDSVSVEATVENDGATPGNVTVPFTVDGETVDEQTVSLEPGETTTLSTNATFDEAGTYTVGAANATTEVTVNEGDDEMPGFGVTAAVLAALVATLIGRRQL